MAESAVRIPEDISGKDLAAVIRRAAGDAGMSLEDFLTPVTRRVQTWIYQLGNARRPKARTIARIQALLRGEPVPPPPLNNFQKTGAPRQPFHVASRGPIKLPPRIAPRDPCSRCGTRADIGCRHTRSALARGAVA